MNKEPNNFHHWVLLVLMLNAQPFCPTWLFFAHCLVRFQLTHCLILGCKNSPYLWLWFGVRWCFFFSFHKICYWDFFLLVQVMLISFFCFIVFQRVRLSNVRCYLRCRLIPFFHQSVLECPSIVTMHFT